MLGQWPTSFRTQGERSRNRLHTYPDQTLQFLVLKLAAQSPEDNQRQEMPFCASATDQTEDGSYSTERRFALD